MQNLCKKIMGALPPMHELARQVDLDLPEFLGRIAAEQAEAQTPNGASPEWMARVIAPEHRAEPDHETANRRSRMNIDGRKPTMGESRGLTRSSGDSRSLDRHGSESGRGSTTSSTKEGRLR